jgi:hypothetical protein
MSNTGVFCIFMDSVLLLLGRRRDVGRSIRLGFLGRWPFRCEDPQLSGLDSLGFPWILSCESSFFNGLCGIKRGQFFLALFPWLSKRRDGRTQSRATRKRRIVHGASLLQFRNFSNNCHPFQPSQSKARARVERRRRSCG